MGVGVVESRPEAQPSTAAQQCHLRHISQSAQLKVLTAARFSKGSLKDSLRGLFIWLMIMQIIGPNPIAHFPHMRDNKLLMLNTPILGGASSTCSKNQSGDNWNATWAFRQTTSKYSYVNRYNQYKTSSHVCHNTLLLQTTTKVFVTSWQIDSYANPWIVNAH